MERGRHPSSSLLTDGPSRLRPQLPALMASPRPRDTERLPLSASRLGSLIDILSLLHSNMVPIRLHKIARSAWAVLYSTHEPSSDLVL